jgi:predicted dehydrogenase
VQGLLPDDRPTRVGVVGLGQIFTLNSAAYRGFPEAEIVALCDRDPARLEDRGSCWPAAARYSEIDKFLTHDMDVVEILVPSPLHSEITCAVLDAGFHVNLQKPMASDLAEADRMIAAARRSGRVLRVMENYVFYQPLRVLRQIVESGEIGSPAGFHMKMVATGRGGWEVPWETWQWQFEQARRTGHGILLYDDGWHKLSVALWLFGPVNEVMAWIGATEVVPGITIDAPTTLMWNHENGVRGVWDITFAPDMLTPSHYYSSDERFEVQGRRGFARVNRCTARVRQEPSLEVYVDGESRSYHALDDDWGSSFRDSTRQYLRWLRGDPAGELLWSAEEARAVMQFLTAARLSSEHHAPVRIEDVGG